MAKIRLPYEPRPYQAEAHRRRRRRTCLVWHRRAGKTTWTVAEMVDTALRHMREGVRLWYIAPYLKQARSIFWLPLLRMIRPLVDAGLARVHHADLAVTIGEARIEVHGASDPDRLRGAGLLMVVYDECAQMPPETWREITQPMLADHAERAVQVWIGTPAGPNHFKDLFDELSAAAEAGDPDVFVDVKTWRDTGVLPEDFIRDARDALGPDLFAQEFECSWTAAVRGAYYADLLDEAEREGRIGHWPPVRDRPAVTAWDLGVADETAIWVAQADGGGWRLVRCIVGAGADFAYYARELDRLGLRFERHYLPHDAAARDIGSARTRISQLAELGIRPAQLVPRHRLEDGIAAVRALLRRCRLDREGCAEGLRALALYRREWYAERGVFGLRPVHDWTSHAADALRYLAVGAGPEPPAARRRQVTGAITAPVL